MGTQNQKLLRELKIHRGHTFIRNPRFPERKVWAFCDVPHALKLLRNHLLDSGFQLESGEVISKSILETLIRNDSTSDLKYCHKLTADHILVAGTGRQNVRKAAELLSGTVAKAIFHKFPLEKHMSEFIDVVNDGFDVLNSRAPMHPTCNMKSAYGISPSSQEEALNKLERLCETMRVVGKTKMLPFQTAFLVSIESLRGLFADLKKEDFSYIMTPKLNQDILESFFSQLRSLGRFYDTLPHLLLFID